MGKVAKGLVKIIIGSNEKIRTELGWLTNITLEQSLAEIINY
jgi:hypothetical protein